MNENETNIQSLIGKYFEGLTSLEEEQWLRKYFSKATIPAEWEAYKAIFRFFASEREANETKSLPVTGSRGRKIYLRWAGIAAAACVLLYAGVRFTLGDYQAREISRAYINGEVHTNRELIQSEVLTALESLSEGNEAAFAAQIEALEVIELGITN
jgi:hypothetical protein